MTLIPNRLAGRLALPLVVLAAACSDGSMPTAPELAPAPGAPARTEALWCVASPKTRSVGCQEGTGAVMARGAHLDVATYGGQRKNVTLTSSNVAYDSVSGVFAFDVTVQNLLPEAIGTADGVTVDPSGIRVFFAQAPAATAGQGDINVAADGFGTFTSSNQPYFQYSVRLDSGQVSPAKRWQLEVPKSVQTFAFQLYISTQAAPLLAINEIMANPAAPVEDSVGEYVELFNRGRLPVNLKGFSVQDNSATRDTITDDLVVPAGGYVLLGRSANTAKNGGIPVDYVYTRKIGTTSGNLTLGNSAADRFVLKGPSGVTVDSVGYTSSSIGAKSGVARELINPALDNQAVDGANWQDATSTYSTGNKGSPRQANGGYSSTTPTAGTPATVTLTPASVSLIPGGTQQMTATARDSAGVATAASYTWTSTDTTVAKVSTSGLVSGVANGSAMVIVAIPNGRADTSTVTVTTPSSGAVYRNHLEFGMPVAGAGAPGDIIVLNKTQYVVGYSPTRGGPAWVSWDLNASHFGAAARCDCFSPDGSLPTGVYRVVTGDYTGSGYDRGHMVMSAQRTATSGDNQIAFLMTNILPQHHDMNAGPWEKFETYTNALAKDSAREVYNVSGGAYPASPSYINNAGKVQLPSSTWKVIVILPAGQGLSSVKSAADIRVIAVDMPNVAGIATNGWQMYTTTVDAIEAATGLDLLSALPDDIEAAVEASR